MAGFHKSRKYGIFNLTCPLKQPGWKCLRRALMRHTVKVMNMNAVLWFMSFDLIPFGRISTVQHQRKFAFDVSCSQYSLTVIKKKIQLVCGK